MYVKKRPNGEKYGFGEGARVAAFGRDFAWIRANPIVDKAVVTVTGATCSESAISEDIDGKVALITRAGTGVVVNSLGRRRVAQGQGSIAVDGVDATTKFSVDDHVYKADGTDVGVVTTVTATLLTFRRHLCARSGANTLAAVNNDDHLHAGIGIGEYAVH